MNEKSGREISHTLTNQRTNTLTHPEPIGHYVGTVAVVSGSGLRAKYKAEPHYKIEWDRRSVGFSTVCVRWLADSLCLSVDSSHATPAGALLLPHERALAVDASDRASPTAAEIFEGRDFEREDLLLAG